MFSLLFLKVDIPLRWILSELVLVTKSNLYLGARKAMFNASNRLSPPKGEDFGIEGSRDLHGIHTHIYIGLTVSLGGQ